MSKNFQRFGIRRIRDELRAVSDRAVAIRKQLSCTRRKNSPDGGNMGDALQLAETIEILGDFGQTCSAEDAVDIASRVEVLISMLEVEVDSFLTS